MGDPNAFQAKLRTLLLVMAVVGGAWVAGCSPNKPTLIGPARKPDPKIILGPYLTRTPDGGVIARFQTDQACVAGIRAVGGRKRVQRIGIRTTRHALRLDSMVGIDDECEILIDNVTGATVRLQAPIAEGDRVHLAFLGGGRNRPDAFLRAADSLKDDSLDGIFLVGGNDPGDGADLEQWRTQMFNPLRCATSMAPLYLLPEVEKRVPENAWPAGNDGYWSRTLGCVHVIALDAVRLRTRQRQVDLLEWLRRDLAARPVSTRWTIVLLAHPLFGGRLVNARALETLGDILDENDVDLVISNGATYYHRSLPLQVGRAQPLRYIVTGGLDKPEAPTAGREYTGALSADPHVCLLDANQDHLTWTARSFSGRVLDRFVLNPDGTADTSEPPIDKLAVTSGAFAKDTLRREVLNVARQACQAVDDPAKPQNLRFVIANPSPEAISGQLFWDIPEDAGWTVRPEGFEFKIDSGFEGVASFKVKPTGKSGPPPVLTVNMKGVGSTQQPLTLTRLKETLLYPAPNDAAIDGMVDAFWKDAAPLQGFEVLSSGATPEKAIEARVAYNAVGLLFMIRCHADAVDRLRSSQVRHDDPIHKDESVEVFIDPTGRGRQYYQFAVNIDNIPLDRSSRLGLAWNPVWKHAVQRNRRADVYTVEMLIPYRAIGVNEIPRPGDSWRINVTRNDWSIAPPPPDAGEQPGQVPLAVEVSQWAQTKGSNARSACYGVARFSTFEKPAETEKKAP